MTGGYWNHEEYKANFLDVFAILDWVKPFFENVNFLKGSRVLEVGCGSGKFSALFALMGFKVTCSDESREMLKRAKENFPNINMQFKVAQIPHVLNDFQTKPLWKQPVSYVDTEDYFDLVFNEGTFEHFMTEPEQKEVIQDLVSVIKKHGYLFLYIPLYDSREETPDNEFFYTKETYLEVFTKSGLFDKWMVLVLDWTSDSGVKKKHIAFIGRKK